MKIAFIGAGSFGTSLAILFANKGYDTAIYARDINVINDINNNKKNEKYFKNISIPSNIRAYSNIENTLNNSTFIFLAVPSSAIRKVCNQIKQYINDTQIVINMAKGIEKDSLKRLSEVIQEELSNNDIVVLSGPSHAEEVVINTPTTVVVSSLNMNAAKKVQNTFTTESFRIYTNEDIIGVEIGAAAKNIIAFAAGILDGIGFGDNTKAALITRGIKEIVDVGTVLGGKQSTFFGLTGIGDLIVTCTSMHSRNRKAGILIGKGMKLEKVQNEIGMVIEGIQACSAFYKLKLKYNIEMPITTALYNCLYRGDNPKTYIQQLMNRKNKPEFDDLL